VLFRSVGASADSTAGVVSTKGCRVSISLAVVTLRTPTVGDVVLQLALSIADNKVLATNASLFNVSSECHNNCGMRFVFPSVGRDKPSWCLALDKLGIVGCNTISNFGWSKMSWNAMK
jgi:hypothetical protein